MNISHAFLAAQGLSEYPNARHTAPDGSLVTMAARGDQDYLLADAAAGFTGKELPDASGSICVLAPLDHQNADLLRVLFPFTAPIPVLTRRRTVGVGDRLGIATPGHLRVFARYDASPILAQQSIRELTVTHRTFEDVLDCATFAVFREDFQRGFGADGDHLKTPEEIEYALRCGYKMITLDCSEHINGDAAHLDHTALDTAYQPDPALEALYLGRSFELGGLKVHFEPDEFRRAVLIYGEALSFIDKIYHIYIQGRPVDFEISIDETQTPTTPLQHFFVSNELRRRGVTFATIAPRFCGEFQKGVDYIGDLDQFTAELKQHAAIADHFGYKLSVHSGSDKFSVFPAVGQETHGHFHVKTAGTSWLEAMKLVAMRDPALYREVHAFALDAFAEARTYYHVTTDLSKIPALDTLSDAELPALFKQNDARQLIHITYGLILTAKGPSGADRFYTRLYRLWRTYAEDYAQLLDAHIGHHLELLYSQIPDNC